MAALDLVPRSLVKQKRALAAGAKKTASFVLLVIKMAN